MIETRTRHFLSTCAVLLTVTTSAHADSIWIGNAKNPIKADGVTVLRIEKTNLIFQSLGGSEVTKPLDAIQQIAVDNEPAFNTAEAAFRAGNHVLATQNYQSALQSSSNTLVRDRSALRITGDAGLTHRFDAAVTAYIYLVKSDPSAAVLPDEIGATPTMVAAAADELTKALNPVDSSGNPKPALPPPQQSAMLRLAITVFQAQGKPALAEAALGKIVALKMATPFELAHWQLSLAQAALDANAFAQAAAAINQHRDAFVDSGQQVQALYILARSADGLLQDRSDTTALKDLAIAYMRVVTFGNDLPAAPHVAASLLRVGQIEEELKEPAVARDVYRQVTSNFPTDPAASTAKASLDRLTKPA